MEANSWTKSFTPIIVAIWAALNITGVLSTDQYKRQFSNSSNLLNVFQVTKPVPAPQENGICENDLLLMDYVFALSYGKPFVGPYIPPPCEFNSVTMTLTVTSAGRQFDRLALMYLGDIEVFRHSTAEPTADGIIFKYTKDMTQYLSLWKEPQTIIFDLGNLIDDTYTASFNTTLRATFFTQEDAPETADLILPISAKRGSQNAASAFTFPADNATVVQTFPAGVSRAIVSIAACGQSTEEFWYTNVLSSDTDTFTPSTGALYGFSPFREVQLYIDGNLAGVAWPFPVIFTGGVAPGFWRPVVGIDAFDLREYEIDITPWLTLLNDGLSHTFSIKVTGLNDTGGQGPATLSETVGNNWVLTGKIFLFEGSSNSTGNVTAGILPRISAPSPDLALSSSYTQNATGANETLLYTVSVARSFSVSSSTGTWTQSLSYSNNGLFTSQGLTQRNTQTTNGLSSAQDSATGLNSDASFSYPIDVNTTFQLFGQNIKIDADINRGLEIHASGRPDLSVYTLVSGPSTLDTTQFGTARYSSVPNNTYNFGDTTQDFVETSLGSSYSRHVHAVNGSVVEDSQGSATRHVVIQPDVPLQRNVRAMLGRGPGSPK
ncbi:MAG: hypothetical protein Q9160_004678 [Pyrenula sp. 1 TL-2023]